MKSDDRFAALRAALDDDFNLSPLRNWAGTIRALLDAADSAGFMSDTDIAAFKALTAQRDRLAAALQRLLKDWFRDKPHPQPCECAVCDARAALAGMEPKG